MKHQEYGNFLCCCISNKLLSGLRSRFEISDRSGSTSDGIERQHLPQSSHPKSGSRVIVILGRIGALMGMSTTF
jgi:hypothetical protein